METLIQNTDNKMSKQYQSLNFKNMKRKIALILAFIGMIGLQSCTVREEVRVEPVADNDTISEVMEVTTSFGSGNNFSRLVTFNPPIYASDVVLVYHLYDVVNGNDIWRLMPQTYYLSSGRELDYNFDYTRYDVNIFLGANFDMNTLTSDWTQNQTFRIVIVPASFKTAVNYTDYDTVIKTFGIDESKIKKIN